MAGAAGIFGQYGIANEVTVNTPIAVTVFTEGTSDGVEWRPNFAEGHGLHAGGLFGRSHRRILTSADAGGMFTFNIPTKGFGKYLQAMMGSYGTTATVLSGAAYQQIHNAGSADGKTFSWQKGVPDIGGTVNPFTASGCKVADWTLTSAPNAIASVALNIDAMALQPTGAGALGLQTASYSGTTALWAFNNLAVTTFSAMTVASGLWTPTTPVEVKVRNLTMKGGQPKDNTRWVSNSLVKAESLVNNFQPLTGTIDIDYGVGASTNTWFTQFQANTSIGLQFNFTGALIGGSNYFLLQFTLPAVFLEQGSTPILTGPGITTVSYPWTALDDDVNGAVQVQYVSTDTSV